MDARYINAFLEALVHVLESFGVAGIKRGSIIKKENMHVDMDITSVTGLVGSVRGNVAYSLSQDTAKMIVSKMMLGTPITEFNEFARSAIGEMANMITGTASNVISGMAQDKSTIVDTTPPSVIFGKDVYFIISSVPTIAVGMDTEYGRIEVNIGLEV